MFDNYYDLYYDNMTDVFNAFILPTTIIILSTLISLTNFILGQNNSIFVISILVLLLTFAFYLNNLFNLKFSYVKLTDILCGYTFLITQINQKTINLIDNTIFLSFLSVISVPLIFLFSIKTSLTIKLAKYTGSFLSIFFNVISCLAFSLFIDFDYNYLFINWLIIISLIIFSNYYIDVINKKIKILRYHND